MSDLNRKTFSQPEERHLKVFLLSMMVSSYEELGESGEEISASSKDENWLKLCMRGVFEGLRKRGSLTEKLRNGLYFFLP